jgi:hypothetical protein
LVINSKYKMTNQNGLFYQIVELKDVLTDDVPF